MTGTRWSTDLVAIAAGALAGLAHAGRGPPPPFRYRHTGSLATIGRKSAVADFGWIRLSGVVAWWLWGFVHVFLPIGGRNRTSVAIEWLWAYLTFKRGTRLITSDQN